MLEMQRLEAQSDTWPGPTPPGAAHQASRLALQLHMLVLSVPTSIGISMSISMSMSTSTSTSISLILNLAGQILAASSSSKRTQPSIYIEVHARL